MQALDKEKRAVYTIIQKNLRFRDTYYEKSRFFKPLFRGKTNRVLRGVCNSLLSKHTPNQRTAPPRISQYGRRVRFALRLAFGVLGNSCRRDWLCPCGRCKRVCPLRPRNLSYKRRNGVSLIPGMEIFETEHQKLALERAFTLSFRYTCGDGDARGIFLLRVDFIRLCGSYAFTYRKRDSRRRLRPLRNGALYDFFFHIPAP